MSGGRTVLVIVILIILSSLFVIGFFAVRYMSVFNIDSVSVIGLETVPQSVSTVLAQCIGVNRFTLDENAIEEMIEENALVDSCTISYSFPSSLEAMIVPSGEDCLLYDGSCYYLMSDGRPVALDSSDSQTLGKEFCVLEVSPDFISYMQKYCEDEYFESVRQLASTLNEAEGWLITRIKYDNNTGNGFGQIVLSLDSLHSDLFVRERVSSSRIAQSIAVIQTSIEEDPALALSVDTLHWDLYSDALVRRMVAT